MACGEYRHCFHVRPPNMRDQRCCKCDVRHFAQYEYDHDYYLGAAEIAKKEAREAARNAHNDEVRARWEAQAAATPPKVVQ